MVGDNQRNSAKSHGLKQAQTRTNADEVYSNMCASVCPNVHELAINPFDVGGPEVMRTSYGLGELGISPRRQRAKRERSNILLGWYLPWHAPCVDVLRSIAPLWPPSHGGRHPRLRLATPFSKTVPQKGVAGTSFAGWRRLMNLAGSVWDSWDQARDECASRSAMQGGVLRGFGISPRSLSTISTCSKPWAPPLPGEPRVDCAANLS